MRGRFSIVFSVLFLLILPAGDETAALGQEEPQNTSQGRIIDLTQGCKLIFDANVDLTDTISMKIVDGIRDILPRIQRLIPADSVTIRLARSSSEVLPMLGVGSTTTGVHSISFYFDPRNSNFRIKFIPNGLAHEFLHASRFRMPHWQLTLLECMMTEGLADHFMVEVVHGEQPAWSRALTEEEIQRCIARVKPILFMIHDSWNAEFNEKYFSPWMLYGRTGDDPIPGWTGYTLGWRFVENYLKAHPEVRASSLVMTPAEEIICATPELSDSE